MECGDTAAPLIFLSSIILEDVQEKGGGGALTDSNMLIWNVADHSYSKDRATLRGWGYIKKKKGGCITEHQIFCEWPLMTANSTGQ